MSEYNYQGSFFTKGGGGREGMRTFPDYDWERKEKVGDKLKDVLQSLKVGSQLTQCTERNARRQYHVMH